MSGLVASIFSDQQRGALQDIALVAVVLAALATIGHHVASVLVIPWLRSQFPQLRQDVAAIKQRTTELEPNAGSSIKDKVHHNAAVNEEILLELRGLRNAFAEHLRQHHKEEP